MIVRGQLAPGARIVETEVAERFGVSRTPVRAAFQRLERAGLLDAEWRRTDNARRAKFYTLSRAGRKRLEAETADWERRAAAVARLLKSEA